LERFVMTPEQTIGPLLATNPLIQTALVLGGCLLMLWELRDIRKRLNAAGPAKDHGTAISLCNDLIARRAKTLVGAAMLIEFGLCFVLATAGLLTPAGALSLLAIVFFTTVLPATSYFMFWGAPLPVLRWLFDGLTPSLPGNT
jgi:predicted PurR-regulated permease PerM